MDLDAFVAVHRPEWDRLDVLARRRRLRGTEVDELVQLYQRAATHLSVIRTAAPDPSVVGRLSRTVAIGRSAVTGAQEPIWREVARVAVVSFPVAVYRARWWAIGWAIFSVVLGTAVGVWVAVDPHVQASLGTDEQIRQLVEADFKNYYSEHPAAAFAAKVWTNNAWISAQAIAMGISGIGVLYVMTFNALNVGVAGGLMAAHGRLGEFFGLITPHGLLELSAVFVAAGAGTQLFWAWVDPGPVPRSTALAREGRAMVTVAMGLVVVLLVSGVIEAFVTPSPLPTWARIGIGFVAWSTFVAYVAILGRRGAAAGETGDVRAGLAGDEAPVLG